MFFIEDRLQRSDLSGLFFMIAGVSPPYWSKAAARIGPRQVLVFAMSLAKLSFVGAAWQFSSAINFNVIFWRVVNLILSVFSYVVLFRLVMPTLQFGDLHRTLMLATG